MDERDRGAIIARRRRLVAAALTAVACGRQTAGPPRAAAEPPGAASMPHSSPGEAAERSGAGDGGVAEPITPIAPGPDAAAPHPDELDSDADGVVDSRDRCPDVAGVDDVSSMQAGCPPRPCLSIVPPSQIQVVIKIQFERGRSDVRADAAASLDELARTLDRIPELELEVVGHCDASEPDDLALQRAQRVRSALLARGVSPPRLAATGEGSRRPVASNATSEGRARNRRVEFVARGPRRPLGN